MNLIMIVFLVFMIGLMWWQSKKAKKQQQEKQDFRANLQPGTEVITIGGVIGKVVSVDTQYEEIVIDSEGSKLRFGFSAISREYVRPAYVSDDEVDENGNPLPKDDVDNAQVPVETAVVAAAAGTATAEAGENAD
ncbi:preprotein translocase subunit YajC [Bifidobacterium ramosum]|nr:preprotein translocase subunit YajC [Bifidobacterium ramosum]